MKGALKKELKSTIKFNLSRFISVIVIIFLGVSFYIGMTTNSSVLKKAMNNYLEEYNYWDIKVYSYLGLTDDDIETIKSNVTDIEEIEGKYYTEALINLKNKDGRKTDYPIFIHSYSDDYIINKLQLVSGRMVKGDNECLVDVSLAKKGKKIGDTITFKDASLKNEKFVIVGIVEDPQYISKDKGVSTVQGNMVKYTAYVSERNFTSKDKLYYTFDVRVKDKYKRFTTDYEKHVDNVTKQIESESEAILSVQLDKYIADKTVELEEAEKEYAKKKEAAQAELQKASNAIKNGERQIKNLELMLLPDSKIDLYVNALRSNLEASKKSLETSDRSIVITNELLDIAQVMYARQRGNDFPDLVCEHNPGAPDPRPSNSGTYSSGTPYYSSTPTYSPSPSYSPSPVSSPKSSYEDYQLCMEYGDYYYENKEYCSSVMSEWEDYYKYINNNNNNNNNDNNSNNNNNNDSDPYADYWVGDLTEDEIEECWSRLTEKEYIQQKAEAFYDVENLVRSQQEMLSEMYSTYNSFDCTDIGTPELTKICKTSRAYLKQRIQEQEENIADLDQDIDSFREELQAAEDVNDIIDISRNYVDRTKKIQQASAKLYEEALNEYNGVLTQLNRSERNVNREITTLEKKLEQAKDEYDKQKKEVSDRLEKNYKEIIKARKFLTNIKKHPWVINTREDSYGYGNYKNDIIRLENIARILPMIFFIVASLVIAISISRLVEEERRKIGILKSLGCNKEQIIRKYTIYAFRAALIGLVLGIIAGIFGFPLLTSKVYSILYYIPPIKYAFYLKPIIVVFIISMLSTVAVAYLSANKVASTEPAKLLRYKQVKNSPLINIDGNKGILKYLSNTRKLVYRNLLTTPLRSIMTIAGIIGCTTLVIASFNIRQSIIQYTQLQFSKIYNIDAEFYYKPEMTQADIKEDYNELVKMEDVKNISVGRKDMLRMKDDQSIELYGVTPDSVEKFEMNTNLYSVLTKEKTTLKDQTGVIITEKLAKLLNIQKGDVITFIDSSNIEHSVTVNDICENYLYNYIYMNKKTYKKVYGYELQNNFMSIKYKEGVDTELFNSDIYTRGNYSNLVSINFYLKQHANTVKTLDSIIFIIILSAAALAFVVIYNISKISVSEKTIEIATLKVLGYKNRWVGRYLKTELRILEFIGIVAGLVGGYFLSDAVLSAVESNYMMFYHGIILKGYIYGVLLTIIFMLVMNVLIYFDQKKVDMSQALKSQEQ